MTKYQKVALFLARIALGWMFFYSGISAVLNPAWSAAGYIGSAKNFIPFYHALLQPSVLPFINFVNAWGLTLLGVSLILGAFVRWGAVLGAILMILYYFVLPFPKPNAHSYIVDEHIIYAVALLIMSAFQVGKLWGLDSWLSKKFKLLA